MKKPVTPKAPVNMVPMKKTDTNSVQKQLTDLRSLTEQLIRRIDALERKLT